TVRPPQSLTKWVLTAEEFATGVVGGKSNNLNALRGRLPDWIHTPKSIALPFGAFEAALRSERNRHVRERYAQCRAATASDAKALAELRSAVLQLHAPDDLRQALSEAWQKVRLPETGWEQIWRGVTRVWASKWTDRAYFSRRGRGVAHDSVFM